MHPWPRRRRRSSENTVILLAMLIFGVVAFLSMTVLVGSVLMGSDDGSGGDAQPQSKAPPATDDDLLRGNLHRRPPHRQARGGREKAYPSPQPREAALDDGTGGGLLRRGSDTDSPDVVYQKAYPFRGVKPELSGFLQPDIIPNGKITFVLCTWSGDSMGFARVPMLFASVEKFMDRDSLEEFLVVTPEASKDAVRAAITGTPLPVRLLADYIVAGISKDEARAYLPKSERRENGGRGVSYRLQMLLKLGVARHVTTEYYVTLDNDVFLKRPTTASDLVPYNVALVQGREPNRHRASWWTSAASILRSGKQCGLNLKTDAFQIGVTPAVLRTSLTRELLSFVEAMHPPSPEEGGQPNNYARALFRLL